MISSNTLEWNQTIQFPSQRILIVEDDPVMQLGLEQFFEEYSQYQIVGIATDGYLGVEAAMKLQPDLVIMDIRHLQERCKGERPRAPTKAFRSCIFNFWRCLVYEFEYC